MYDYDKTCAKFLEVNCQITDTKEEYEKRNKTEKISKCNYIASCGHQHVVFINVFFSRKTGLVCPSCKSKENGIKKKEEIKDDKLKYLKIEVRCINYFKEICKGFEIHKAFDGCRADLIARPISEKEDKWIGIQVKTTERNNHYEFGMHQTYDDYLILCICEEDKRMWLFPYEDLNGVTKIHVGNKSKYNKYEIENISYLSKKLSEYYQITKKFTYEELDKPLCIYTQREREFYRYRESKMDFLDFTYNDMEGIVYDFKIGDKKFQEKVGCIDKVKNANVFSLFKNNGMINGKRCQKNYDIGDNDYYWLNADDKKLFYVIPEQILIEKGYVGYKGKKQLKINPKETKYNEWIQPYKFNYNSFGLFEKNRLLKILKMIL